MVYKFYGNIGDPHYIKERHSNSQIAYISKKSVDDIYKEGSCFVIGEIGNIGKTSNRQNVILTDEGKKIPIFPLGSLMKPFEWVAGYAPIGEGMYVAVIKSIVPGLGVCK